MKKILLAALAVAVVAFAPSKSVTTAEDSEIRLHNHAEAASATWQCKNCGSQIHCAQNAPPPREYYGCGGQWNRRHIWEKLN